MRWKNGLSDLDGEETKNDKIVQLKEIAGEAGDDCPSPQYFRLLLISRFAVHQPHIWN
jgi:hypothetical protein